MTAERPDDSQATELGPTLDFGGTIGGSDCAPPLPGTGFPRRTTDEATRREQNRPHDPFRQKPPGYPSLF